MNPTRYQFNYSQDIVHLQTKFSLFRRVSNILFSLTFENGFNVPMMKQAIKLLVERNDCLRLKFEKKKGKIYQYFRPENPIGEIPQKHFDTFDKLDSFINKFRKKAVNLFKGETFKVVFITNAAQEQMILVKISHFVADTYGIGVLVNDLNAIYKALVNNEQLPDAPGRFEDVIRKDNEYRANEEATEKDRQFFNEYYQVRHREHPIYCGLHGNYSDIWLKLKRKGAISLPYFLVKCDTDGSRFVIPSSVSEKVEQWCSENNISMNTFFFYTCAIACSLRNDRAKYQLPLELLNCRATVADRKAAGTKVQSLSVYTTVDYQKSFNENIALLFAEQSELYRHTRLSYLEVQDIEHKLWNYSMLSQITNFCFSFIPTSSPKGIRLQVYSNGKGALAAYIALMFDVDTKEIYVTYDVQRQMCSSLQLIEFQNIYIHVIESVLSQPDEILNKIL